MNGLQDNSMNKTDIKKRFCKHCGGVIDIETKRCSSCGKQYGIRRFVPKRFNLFPILIISILGNAFFAKTTYDYKQKYENKLEDWHDSQESIVHLKSQQRRLEDSIESKEGIIEYYKETLESYSEECRFFDENSGIVTVSGEKYHTYDCWHWQTGNGFLIYNIAQAESLGYEPCLDCH